MATRDLLHAIRTTMLAGLVIAALLLAFVAQASAHASLIRADPADGAVIAAWPGRLVLTFNEPVVPLALRLIRPDGDALPLDGAKASGNAVEIEAPRDLGEGTHVLSWRVVSADGHPVGGSVVFSIGAPGATPPMLADPVDRGVLSGLWATRVALSVGFFLGIGGAVAIAWLLPASASGTAFVRAALAVGLAGTALSPGFQGLDALGGTLSLYFDPTVWRTGMETSQGRTVEAMLLAILLGLVATLARPVALSRGLATAGLAAGAFALSLSGHASAAEPQWLTRPSVFAHAATIALWTGALVPLGLALRANAADATSALRGFSRTIPFALLLLVASGLVLAVIQVGQVAALADTAYGRLLVAKLALLLPVAALAAFNRWRLTTPAMHGGTAARTPLARSIAAETFVVLLVFAVAAGWRFTPPPRALAIAAAQPATMHLHTATVMADLEISPGRAGPVTISAVMMTGDFGPLDAREVTFVLSNPAAGIEPFRRPARKPGDGTWRADEIVLPLPGDWTIRLDILVTNFDLARVEGTIAIRP